MGERSREQLTTAGLRGLLFWRWRPWPCWRSPRQTLQALASWPAGTTRHTRWPTTSSCSASSAACRTGSCSRTPRRTEGRIWWRRKVLVDSSFVGIRYDKMRKTQTPYGVQIVWSTLTWWRRGKWFRLLRNSPSWTASRTCCWCKCLPGRLG